MRVRVICMTFEGVYVIESSKDWFQLRWEGTHCTLCAALGWDSFSKKVKRLVQRYRSPFRLKTFLSRLEDKGKIASRIEYENREKAYNERSEDLEIKLSHVIRDAMEEVKCDKQVNRNMKRFKKVNLSKEDAATKNPADSSDIFDLLDSVLDSVIQPEAKPSGLKLKPKLKLIAAN